MANEKLKEKVWYTSKNARKAKSTIKDHFKSTQADSNKGFGTHKTQMPAKGKEKVTKGRNNRKYQTSSAEDIIGAIVNQNSQSRDKYQDVISRVELEHLISRVLIPWSNGCFKSGSLMSQSSKELDPDPFNNITDFRDRWLSDTTLVNCVSDFQDMFMMNNNLKIYNLGASARGCFLREQRRGPSNSGWGYMQEYVSANFGMQRLTRNT